MCSSNFVQLKVLQLEIPNETWHLVRLQSCLPVPCKAKNNSAAAAGGKLSDKTLTEQSRLLACLAEIGHEVRMDVEVNERRGFGYLLFHLTALKR